MQQFDSTKEEPNAGVQLSNI